MKTLMILLSLAAAVPAHAAAFGAWKTTATWVKDSLPAGIHARNTWLELQGDPQKFNDTTCPYPGDAAYAAMAIPRVTSNPVQYSSYVAGQPESFLNLSPAVNYYVPCEDGTVGLVDMRFFQGKWQAGSYSMGSTPDVFKNLASARDADKANSGLSSDNYFNLELLPIDFGAAKTFGGAEFVARETDGSFQLIPTMDVPELKLQKGQWLPADQVMSALAAYYKP